MRSRRLLSGEIPQPPGPWALPSPKNRKVGSGVMTTEVAKQQAGQASLRDVGIGATMAVPVMAFVAFTFQQLWGWFIVPTLAVPRLSFAMAAGIYLVILVIMPSSPRKEPLPTGMELGMRIARRVFECALFLAIGFAIHIAA